MHNATPLPNGLVEHTRTRSSVDIRSRNSRSSRFWRLTDFRRSDSPPLTCGAAVIRHLPKGPSGASSPVVAPVFRWVAVPDSGYTCAVITADYLQHWGPDHMEDRCVQHRPLSGSEPGYYTRVILTGASHITAPRGDR